MIPNRDPLTGFSKEKKVADFLWYNMVVIYIMDNEIFTETISGIIAAKGIAYVSFFRATTPPKSKVIESSGDWLLHKGYLEIYSKIQIRESALSLAGMLISAGMLYAAANSSLKPYAEVFTLGFAANYVIGSALQLFNKFRISRADEVIKIHQQERDFYEQIEIQVKLARAARQEGRVSGEGIWDLDVDNRENGDMKLYPDEALLGNPFTDADIPVDLPKLHLN